MLGGTESQKPGQPINPLRISTWMRSYCGPRRTIPPGAGGEEEKRDEKLSKMRGPLYIRASLCPGSLPW